MENGDVNQRRWNDPVRDDPARGESAPPQDEATEGFSAPDSVPDTVPEPFSDPVSDPGQRMRGRGGSKDSYTIGEVVERLRPEFPTLSVSKIRYL